jgi:hypothetical protein
MEARSARTRNQKAAIIAPQIQSGIGALTPTGVAFSPLCLEIWTIPHLPCPVAVAGNVRQVLAQSHQNHQKLQGVLATMWFTRGSIAA